jgi:uncharacterized surface protein with fasciclin (FAS1) repeats
MTIVGGLMLALVATSILPTPTADARWRKRCDVVDTLVYLNKRTHAFDTLLAAVDFAGLEDALRESKPITLFAPTDDAFSEIPEETLEFLLTEEGKPVLTDILLYHVTGKRVSYREWFCGDGQLEMLNGKNTDLSRRRYRLKINDAKIIGWLIPASNGNIFVIDEVLIPPANGEPTGS